MDCCLLYLNASSPIAVLAILMYMILPQYSTAANPHTQNTAQRDNQPLEGVITAVFGTKSWQMIVHDLRDIQNARRPDLVTRKEYADVRTLNFEPSLKPATLCFNLNESCHIFPIIVGFSKNRDQAPFSDAMVPYRTRKLWYHTTLKTNRPDSQSKVGEVLLEYLHCQNAQH